MGRYIIGIDQSTQGTKALLVDEGGHLIHRADRSHRQIVNEAGWVSHDPAEIAANVLAVARAVVEETGVDLVRFFKSIGRGFATVYSTIVRGTPMMVQGLLIYYAGFTVLRGMGFETAQANQIWSTFTAGLVTISLNSTAYMMEVLRGGIESIDPGQAEAARSLGLSQWQAMRKVVFPQGIKNAIPALTNELIINIKDSSVLSVIGVFDLMYATTTVAGVYYRQMEVYCVALVVYLILTLVASRLLEAFGKKLGAEAPATLPSSN